MVVTYVVSFLTGLSFLIAIFYAVSDFDLISKHDQIFPLVEIYRQATGSDSITIGLLAVALAPTFISTVGSFVIVSRTFWALSRNNATPFSMFFSQINKKTKNPFNAIFTSGVLVSLIGCLYIGSARAFDNLVGSFVILTSLSYLTAILPHLLSKRSNITQGWFRMHGLVGYIVNAISCLYLVIFVIVFCLPFSSPVAATDMNYSCVIVGGLSFFVTVSWFWRPEGYKGPQHIPLGVR